MSSGEKAGAAPSASHDGEGGPARGSAVTILCAGFFTDKGGRRFLRGVIPRRGNRVSRQLSR